MHIRIILVYGWGYCVVGARYRVSINTTRIGNRVSQRANKRCSYVPVCLRGRQRSIRLAIRAIHRARRCTVLIVRKVDRVPIGCRRNLCVGHNTAKRLCSKNSVNATSVTKSEISRFRSRRPLPPDPYCSAPTQPPPLAAAWPWQVIGKNAKLNRRRDTFVSEISEFRHRRRD